MRSSVISLVTVLSLVGCQAETVPDETTTPAPITTSPATDTSTTGATTTTMATSEMEPAIYLFFEGYPIEPGPYLAAVSRPGIDDLSEALNALLQGVTEEEESRGLSSTVPQGTELLGVEVSEGVASVDLSREFGSGGGSLSMMGRVAQIVYTATRVEGVDSVRFLLEGSPLEVLGGEGLIIDEPQTRSAWRDLIPPILVEGPPWGSAVGNEIDVTGTAHLESGTVSFVIVDADGLIVYDGEIATTPGQRGQFAVTLVLEEIPHPGRGSIIFWEWAPDGSQRHVVQYPLTLGE